MDLGRGDELAADGPGPGAAWVAFEKLRPPRPRRKPRGALQAQLDMHRERLALGVAGFQLRPTLLDVSLGHAAGLQLRDAPGDVPVSVKEVVA